MRILSPIGLTNNKLWVRNEQHGNLWIKSNFNLDPSFFNFTSYKIVFEALVGRGMRGDVALDEIEFTPNKLCSPVSEFGNTVTSYCDFETNACNYVTASNSTWYKWERKQPERVGGFLEQPNKDNTMQTKDGYYMRLRV